MSDSPDSAFNNSPDRVRSSEVVGIELRMTTGLCNELKDGELIVLRESDMLRAENNLFYVDRSLEIAGDELRMAFCA
jgi:hypothetical protein